MRNQANTYDHAPQQERMSVKTAAAYVAIMATNIATRIFGAFAKGLETLTDTTTFATSFSVGFAIAAIILVIDLFLNLAVIGPVALLIAPLLLVWNTIIIGSYISIGYAVVTAIVELAKPVIDGAVNLYRRAKIWFGMSVAGFADSMIDRMNTGRSHPTPDLGVVR
jgi:hypothetical protein